VSAAERLDAARTALLLFDLLEGHVNRDAESRARFAPVIESAGRVLSRDALMSRVRGSPLEAFDRSIDVHVSRIRAAIEDDPRRPRRIITVRGAGYVFAREAGEDAAG